MSALAAAYFTVVTSVTLVNQKTKVSVHGAGIGGPGTALFFVFGWFAFPVILGWLLVIWSRTTLKQHTLRQSIGGVLIGIIVTCCTYPFVYIV
jgi:membrane-associated phospholipid phosphatase